MEGSAARVTTGARIATIPAARRAIGRVPSELCETFVRARAEDRGRPANVNSDTFAGLVSLLVPRRFQP